MAYGERITVKTRRELERMREAARHVGEILLELRELAKPGVTTAELDRAAERSIERRGVVSSFKGYGPHGLPQYPASVCISVNEEIVHGIPGPRVLEDGDILSLDFGVSVDGWHGDSAVTLPIGVGSSLGSGGLQIPCRGGESFFVRLRALRSGSSGGGTAARFRRS